MFTPGFLEVQLDPKISYGAKMGLGYTTVVVTNPSRIETRFQQQSRGYWKGSIGFSDKSKPQMQAISAFYSRVQGKTWGWRFRNYREYYTCTDDYAAGTIAPEPISTYTSGTTMQLIHTRNPGLTNAEIVLVRKPDMNSAGGTTGTGATQFLLYRDGTLWPHAGNWSLDVTTGIVTFVADQTGHTFSWQGYWDTPARFDVDDMEVVWEDFDVFNWDGINIMEIVV